MASSNGIILIQRYAGGGHDHICMLTKNKYAYSFFPKQTHTKILNITPFVNNGSERNFSIKIQSVHSILWFKQINAQFALANIYNRSQFTELQYTANWGTKAISCFDVKLLIIHNDKYFLFTIRPNVM